MKQPHFRHFSDLTTTPKARLSQTIYIKTVLFQTITLGLNTDTALCETNTQRQVPSKSYTRKTVQSETENVRIFVKQSLETQFFRNNFSQHTFLSNAV